MALTIARSLGLAPPEPPKMSAQVVLGYFESLGNNCELGLVQRHYGLEGVGLLRWGSFPGGFPPLLAALQQRLEGAGAAIAMSEFGEERISHDTRYGITFHTHQGVGAISAEDLAHLEGPRIRYLSQMLIDDLEDGIRIAVYKSTPELSVADARALRDAIGAIGPTTLLWVTQSDDPVQIGTVEPYGPKLLRGYIDRFAPEEAVHSDCSFGVWLQLCRAALAVAAMADVKGSHRFWRVWISVSGADVAAIARLSLHDVLGGPNVATTATRWSASSTFPVPLGFGLNTGAENVLDGTGPLDMWASDTGMPCWIAYDFGGRPAAVCALSLTSRPTNTEQTPQDFQLQWSDDGDVWTPVLDVSGAAWVPGQTRTYDVFAGRVAGLAQLKA